MAKDYTFDVLAEAACCLWEAICEWQTMHVENQWTERREYHGTQTVRHDCIALAETCCRAWDELGQDQQEALIPYDWEFCPRFLLLIDLDTYTTGFGIEGAAFDALVSRLRDAADEEHARQAAEMLEA